MSDPVQRKGPGGVQGPAEGGAPAGAGAAFRAAGKEGAAEAERSAPGSQSGEIAAIAREIRAGTLDPAAAVERLVQRALESPTAAGLPAAQKARLAEVLRAQLAQDPTLQALQRDLGG